ncbi:MAG TPA: hypothetical protein VLD39_05965, partial [Gammaproteobacteria bacterium]|nr:hypothetical protein [Gammaproteobacteria bacterium]
MLILSKYGVHGAWLAGVLVATAVSPLTAGASDAELIDVAGRIDYGYYASDSRIVAAARADLERLPVSKSARSYYLGYSAYRLSQLTSPANYRARRELLASCIDAAAAALHESAWAVEVWVLIAACALEGRVDPVRASGYDLRLSEALDAARELDPDHPRLLLIAALALAA